MTDHTLQGIAERCGRLCDAVTLRTMRAWPNDPVRNASIVYHLRGWSFDANDAELIRAEAARHLPTAQAIEAGTDETRNAAQPEGRERGPKGAPK